MKPLDRIYQAARAHPRHIILPEGDDPRVAEAAARITAEGLARITLDWVLDGARKAGLSVHGVVGHDDELVEEGLVGQAA